jgi:hypothetical protein
MSFLDRMLSAGLLLLVPCSMVAQEPEADALALDSLLSTPIDASGKYQQTAREAASSVTIGQGGSRRRSRYRCGFCWSRTTR